MLDISIILFLASLIGLVILLVLQKKNLAREGSLESDFPSRDVSYESFTSLNRKLKRGWFVLVHGTAVVTTKLWVRLTHYLSSWFRKGFKKMEERLIRIEKKNGAGGPVKRSVFLTTIKTYKREIKKLNGRVEEEMPKAKEGPRVEISEENNNI